MYSENVDAFENQHPYKQGIQIPVPIVAGRDFALVNLWANGNNNIAYDVTKK